MPTSVHDTMNAEIRALRNAAIDATERAEKAEARVAPLLKEVALYRDFAKTLVREWERLPAEVRSIALACPIDALRDLVRDPERVKAMHTGPVDERSGHSVSTTYQPPTLEEIAAMRKEARSASESAEEHLAACAGSPTEGLRAGGQASSNATVERAELGKRISAWWRRHIDSGKAWDWKLDSLLEELDRSPSTETLTETIERTAELIAPLVEVDIAHASSDASVKVGERVRIRPLGRIEKAMHGREGTVLRLSSTDSHPEIAEVDFPELTAWFCCDALESVERVRCEHENTRHDACSNDRYCHDCKRIIEVAGMVVEPGIPIDVYRAQKNAAPCSNEATAAARCDEYLGDNDGTCPQLTCIRVKGHEGPHDNTSDECRRELTYVCTKSEGHAGPCGARTDNAMFEGPALGDTPEQRRIRNQRAELKHKAKEIADKDARLSSLHLIAMAARRWLAVHGSEKCPANESEFQLWASFKRAASDGHWSYEDPSLKVSPVTQMDYPRVEAFNRLRHELRNRVIEVESNSWARCSMCTAVWRREPEWHYPTCALFEAREARTAKASPQ